MPKKTSVHFLFMKSDVDAEVHGQKLLNNQLLRAGCVSLRLGLRLRLGLFRGNYRRKSRYGNGFQ